MPRHLKRGMEASAIKAADAKVRETVDQILADIEARKDAAVRELSQKFDDWSPASFKLEASEIERAIAQVLDLVDDLSDGAGVNTEDCFQWSETPRHLVEVGVHLDANRPGRIHLRVAYTVGHGDVAQSRGLADLVVEGNEGEAETEHQHDHEAELLQQHAIGLGVAHTRP